MPLLNYYIFIWRIHLQKFLNNLSCVQNVLALAPRSLDVGDAPASCDPWAEVTSHRSLGSRGYPQTVRSKLWSSWHCQLWENRSVKARGFPKVGVLRSSQSFFGKGHVEEDLPLRRKVIQGGKRRWLEQELPKAGASKFIEFVHQQRIGVSRSFVSEDNHFG